MGIEPKGNAPGAVSDASLLRWVEDGAQCEARWCCGAGLLPPRRVRCVDDTLRADEAYRLACEGTALLWRGDFQNARQLMQALARRLDKRQRKGSDAQARPADVFHRQRMEQAQRARILGAILIPFDARHVIPLRRAPEVALACGEALGPAEDAYVLSLRELLGLIGAHEWRRKGLFVPVLEAHIHPHYGVFSPVRGEYVRLVAETPLPVVCASSGDAFDIGTGTGVLAAVLARRGLSVVATDMNDRALACAEENVNRLGLGQRIEIRRADLFPDGLAGLVVCNPPWVPAKPTSVLESAVYDPDSRMLKGFLAGLAGHLAPGGEGWLILSDLAEHLGLRSRDDLLAWIGQSGLTVLGRRDVRPGHPRADDASDPLHAARRAEVTSLWRLGAG